MPGAGNVRDWILISVIMAIETSTKTSNTVSSLKTLVLRLVPDTRPEQGVMASTSISSISTSLITIRPGHTPKTGPGID